MVTMTHIRNVRKKAPMVTGLFGPLKDTVLLLKSRGIPMDLPPVNNQAGRPSLLLHLVVGTAGTLLSHAGRQSHGGYRLA